MHRSIEPVWRLFRRVVLRTRSAPDLFNPYVDRDPRFDVRDAPAIRRANFRRYLSSYRRKPEVLAVGEAPGPRGCRFSGVPFTSEAVLLSGALPFTGRRSGVRPRPWREASGGVLWRVLGPDAPRVLIWNAVPLHPHPRGSPLGIRTPRTSEVRAFLPWVKGAYEALRPIRVVAIGRVAETALRLAEIPHEYVRHPSQGGVRRFEEGMRRALRG